MRLRNSFWPATLVLSAGLAWGQVDTSAWPVVRMEVMAMDRKGAMLPVTVDSVTVSEGGRPVKVQAVTAVTEPQSVCLLLDSSGSMYDRMLSVKVAAARMLDALPAADQVCVIDFNRESYLDSDLGRTREQAKKSMDVVKAGGTSSLFDALDAAAAYLRRSGKYSSQAIVALTDGDDNVSKADLAGAVAALYLGGAPAVHVFRLAGLASEDRADRVKGEAAATTLARATGGFAYFPKKRGELEASVEELCRAMANRVTMSYESDAAARDGRERRVSVVLDKAHQKEKAVVAVAEGYYAPSH